MTYSWASWGRPLAWSGAAFASVAFLVAAYIAGLQLSGNFHVVADGSVYRSAQPSEAALERYVKINGIKSVLNLRETTDDTWQDKESRAAAELGVAYFHMPLSAVHLPTAHDIEGVMKILTEAPKPILVHSQLGADRAGLVSALYLYAVEGRPADEAVSQLSPVYGHLPFLGNPTAAMDETFDAVVAVRGGSN